MKFQQARQITHRLSEILWLNGAAVNIEVCDAIRRYEPEINKIIFVVVPGKMEALERQFENLGLEDDFRGYKGTWLGMSLEIRLAEPEWFGCAVLYATGPHSFVNSVEKRATDMGYTLTENGVYLDKVRVAGSTECEIFAALDLPFTFPNHREVREKKSWLSRLLLTEL